MKALNLVFLEPVVTGKHNHVVADGTVNQHAVKGISMAFHRFQLTVGDVVVGGWCVDGKFVLVCNIRQMKYVKVIEF